ncbi:MAG: polysaccharide biosynthesis tyrosine autokinase [Crocosphaera sp.]|uniref:GumC family protein n=1 Tax=Crocosphaera sp. TaxID=2729996 RepID=UPI00258E8FF9|nr:polysaccharide biosynthesis tyrosine autokinase [Crocosphaera sp.]MCH2243151.1 polysaccharide biosynthesis tyrosine autokinase [Crocosphaera sp.]
MSIRNTINSLKANGNQPEPNQNIISYVGKQDEEEISLSWTQIKCWFRRRVWLVGSVFLVVSGSAIAYAWSRPPVYEESFKLLIEIPSETSLIPGLGSGIANLGGLSAPDESYVLTQIQVLYGYKIIAPVLEKIQERYPPETEEDVIKYESFVQNSLRINNPKDTNIIQITYSAQDPKKVNFVLSELANTYLEYSQQAPQNKQTQGLRFVEMQLPELQDKVSQLEGELKRFRQRHNIVDPESQSRLLTTNLTRLIEKQQENRAQLYQAQIRYGNLQQQLGIDKEQARILAALSQSPRYMSLLAKLREVDTKLAAETTRFTGDNPAIRKLNQERLNLLPLIAEEARTILGNVPQDLSANLTSLASPNTIRLEILGELLKTETMIQEQQVRQRELMNTEMTMRREIDNLAEIIREYVDLTRKLEIANNNLTRYLATQQELELEVAKTINPWSLVSEIRTPEEPISSPRKMSVLGVFAGLMLGVGAGLLADKIIDSFHSADELREETKLPLLGTIPALKYDVRRAEGMLLQNDPNFSMFLEAFYFLHTNIFATNSDKKLKSLTISSAIPGEGKSAVAAFLAETAAKIGQKVLLVEGDLRRPQVQKHKRLKVSSEYSLEDILDNQISPEQAIEISSLDQNLHVIAGKPHGRNAPVLLRSEKFSQLMEQWKEKFDLVIVDCPPLVGLPDAKLVSQNTDGLLLVLRLDKTMKDVVKEALGEIKLAQLPLLGVVANGAKQYTLKTYGYYKQYQQYYHKS